MVDREAELLSCLHQIALALESINRNLFILRDLYRAETERGQPVQPEAAP